MKTIANLFLVSMLIISVGNLKAESLYDVHGVTAGEIFHMIETPYNDDVQELIETLDMYDQ